MTISAPKALLALDYRAETGGEAIRLGALAVDEGGRVNARPAAADYDHALAELAEEINAMEVLSVRDAPPGASPLESWSRLVGRDSADFVPALAQLLEERYGLEVTPDAPAGDAPAG